jgi:uncharacterized protein YbjT (DUF2867 family)
MDANMPTGGGPVTLTRTAFVAGATGYTGRALIAELRRRGVLTIAHVRPDSPRLQDWRAEFASLGALPDQTPWDDDAMVETQAQHRPHVVYALLGTTMRRARAARAAEAAEAVGSTASNAAREGYESVDYGLTALLLRATRRAAPGARFVYLSAFGVGPRARGGYMRARWKLEEELRASGLEWTIVRPAFITGPDRPERRPLERTAAIAVDAVLRVARRFGARGLHDRFRSMTAADLACALAGIGFDPAAAHRVLEPDALR